MGHSHSEPHISPLSLYFTVFSCLIVLTFVTVGVSELGLPSTLSIIVAMAVALVKATLVATWFMHLIHDTKLNLSLFLASLWFMGIFFIFTTFDMASRGNVMKMSDSFEFRQKRADDHVRAGNVKVRKSADPEKPHVYEVSTDGGTTWDSGLVTSEHATGH
jgi:cytochrome c oxidase subunit IV